MPVTSQASCAACNTTARMMALRPAQSSPLVRSASRLVRRGVVVIGGIPRGTGVWTRSVWHGTRRGTRAQSTGALSRPPPGSRHLRGRCRPQGLGTCVAIAGRVGLGGRDLAQAGDAPHRNGRLRGAGVARRPQRLRQDRKSTRLNSSHITISYAVFCLKKKKKKITHNYKKKKKKNNKKKKIT